MGVDGSIRIPTHVRSVIDPDGAVVLDLKRGEYYSLNEVGAQIWLKLEAGAAVPDIEAHLSGLYESSADTLRQDITEFLNHLREKHLINVDD